MLLAIVNTTNNLIVGNVDYGDVSLSEDGTIATGTGSYVGEDGEEVSCPVTHDAPAGHCFVAPNAEDLPKAGPGATWTAKDGFVPAPAPIHARTLFSAREFIQSLFTHDERKAIFTARRDDWQVDEFVTLASAGSVDVTDAQVMSGIEYLVGANLVTKQRSKEILAGSLPSNG